MSTLAIHPKSVRLYRLLWDRWIIVLRILFDLGAGSHPVKWRAVAETLLVDKKTCQKYIVGLVRDGHLTTVGDAVMLTSAGMDILLENERGEFLPTSGEFLPGNNSPLLKKLVVVDSELKPLTTSTTSQLGKNPGEKFSPEQTEQASGMFDPDVQTAIEQVSLLFDGSEVTLKGLPYYLHIEKVLGWIAYVYDKREGFARPCGMLYSKLKEPSAPSPSMKYMKDPEAFLPDEYLSAIGRTVVKAEPEPVENYVDTRPRQDETISEVVNDAYWAVWEQWKTESHDKKGEFNRGDPVGLGWSYLEHSWPVHFEEGHLIVGVYNEWVVKEATKASAAMLAERLGWSVEFVVAVETEEG